MATSAILSFPFCVQRFPAAMSLSAAAAIAGTPGLDCRDDDDATLSGLVQIDHNLQGSSIRVSTDHPILVEPGLDIALELLDRPAFQNCPDLR